MSTIWFDVEDLFSYFRSNKRISGIQRLTFEIIRATRALEGQGWTVGFVRHGTRPRSFVLVAWDELAADFEAEERQPAPLGAQRSRPARTSAVQAPADRVSRLRLLGRRAKNLLPARIRAPVVLASVMQVQAVGAVGVFGFNLLRYPVLAGVSAACQRSQALRDRLERYRRRRHARPKAVEHTFAALARPGDVLLVLGAPWMRERYSDIARWVRDERRMRFGVLVHDLVPIRHPEWCPRGVPRAFREWYTDVLPVCDLVMANSRHTADDVAAYARESGLVLAQAPVVLPIGAGFGGGRSAPGSRFPQLPEPGSYVLFVSTMEARKNHGLAVRIWSILLQEVRAGLRAADSLPDLVFAGRVGWLVADLLAQLDNTSWLGGRIRMVRDPTDAELAALYEGCRFTFFPSLYEGWGLPVTESLAFGKPCLTSDAAALPEAGGSLCRYFDPEDLGSALDAVRSVLDDPSGLAAWEERIGRDFRLVPWAQTARAMTDALERLQA